MPTSMVMDILYRCLLLAIWFLIFRYYRVTLTLSPPYTPWTPWIVLLWWLWAGVRVESVCVV
jgi:hypothetical protein